MNIANPGTNPKRIVDLWELDLHETSVEVIRAVDWSALQAVLLRLNYLPRLTLSSGNEGTLRWLVESIVHCAILTPSLRADRLSLLWSDRGRDVEVPLTGQKRYMVDGLQVVLDPVERFEFAVRKASSDLEAYLYLRAHLAGDHTGN